MFIVIASKCKWHYALYILYIHYREDGGMLGLTNRVLSVSTVLR